MKMRISGIIGRCGLIVFPLLITQLSFGEIIPPDRRLTWQGNVGIAGGIPDSRNKPVYATIPAGASLSTVQTAINNCPPNQVVELSAGSYTWGGVLDWSSADDGVVLRGAGMDTTTVTFSSGYIHMRTGFSESSLSTDANLSVDAVKGSSTLTLASVPAWVTPGNLIIIDQLDDPAFVSGAGTQPAESYRELTGNGARGLAQMNRVVSKTATTITLELPLFYAFKTARTAQIAQPAFNPSTTTPLRGCGIENLTLRASYSGSDAHMIRLESCDSCYIKNVEIDNMAGGCGIWSVFSYRCQIHGIYIHDSHLYSGGQGYGVALYHISTGMLTENSIFQNLHNPTSCQFGSSGNVFAYNYIRGGVNSSAQTCSMNTHGVHAWMNLWEGNWGDDKVMADWTHGSGSHNTVFRNRVVGRFVNGPGDQVCISIERYNRYWNIVGNVLGLAGWHNNYAATPTTPCTGRDIYKLGGEVNVNCDFSPSDDAATSAYLIHGNHDVVTTANNGVVWDSSISDRTLPNSYFLSSKPAWFGNRPWPPFDPLNPGAAAITNIPAGYRFVFGFDPPSGPVNQPPLARASASPMSGSAPLAVIFSSSGSVDPEGTALTYSWTFGDGSQNATAANPSHTYQADGMYTASLTVSDGTNSTTSTNLTIRVGNQAPIVVANASPTSGFAPLTVGFSTAGSSDPDGATLSYAWTFGDGGTSTAANPTHTYQNAGSYVAQVTVSDGVKTTVTNVAISVNDPATALVAAYGFEEGAGTSAADRSGNGNTGSITAATWTTGRFGKALLFNGTNALVTVNDSASLGLASGFTLEAWVNPATLGSGWRNIIYKEPDIYFLMGATPQGPPNMGGSFAFGNVNGTGPLPLNTWTHLAGTYDGSTMRLYTNGVLVASRAQTGPVTTTAGRVTIGGDLVTHDNGPQYWSGLIDEVRIYNRALTATEIQADMNTAVSGGAAKPAPPTGLRVAGAQ